MQIHQKKLKANTNSVKYITLSKGIILLNFGCVSVTSRDSIHIRMLHALYYTMIRAFLQSCLLMLPCLSSTVLQNEGFRFPTLAYRQVNIPNTHWKQSRSGSHGNQKPDIDLTVLLSEESVHRSQTV